MDVPVLCSAEEFIAKSNEIIKAPFDHGYYSVCSIYREHGRIERDIENEALANALDLGSAICSMMLIPNSANEPFQPYVQLEDKRTAIADDFTHEQLEFIANVHADIEEPLIKARFADLLWLCINPKKVSYVRVAIQGYLMLPISSETWHSDIGKCWERVIRLSRQISDRDSISKIEAALLIAFEDDYPDTPYMNLWIAELIERSRLCTSQHEYIADKLFEQAKSFHSSCGYSQARKYISLAERIFKFHGNNENYLASLVLYADCFELEGDSRCDENTPSQMVANSFYENALQAYRKVPIKNRDELGVTTKLISIRDKITEAGAGSLSEMRLLKTPGVDISALIKNARQHVADKGSLERTLLYYTGFISPKYQELRTRTIDQIQEFPISNLFGGTHMAGDGRVIAKTPALDLASQNESSELTIFNKTIQNFQFDLQLAVEGEIVPALNQILSEYRVTKEFLKRICYHSPIVPEGREYLMASALWCGFEHDFSNGIHLLAPQLEHLIRTILKNNGVHTSNIDRDGIENENGLTTLLNHERAKDILGEDLLFEIKALFTESVGTNLRNEVAHGLLSDQSSGTIASVYSWWMVLRLVIRSLYEFETKDNA